MADGTAPATTAGDWRSIGARMLRWMASIQGPDTSSIVHSYEATCVAASATAWSLLRRDIANSVEQIRILDDAIRKVQSILDQHATAPLRIVRGLAAEVHHIATFNLNAVKKGSTLRAMSGDISSHFDIHIHDTKSGDVLTRAQCKYYSKAKVLRRALRDSRYDGMQKIVPADRPVPGASPQLTGPGGVRSVPLSLEQGDRLALQPTQHFAALRPNAITQMLRNCALGAAAGIAVGAAAAAVLRTVTVTALERLDKDIDKPHVGSAAAATCCIAESAMLGAAAGALGAAASTLTSSAMLGAVSAGTLGTLYSVWTCNGSPGARVKEAVVGAAGVAGGQIAVAVCTMVPLPVAAPVSLFVYPAAAYLTSCAAHQLALGVWNEVVKTLEGAAAASPS
ncbi:hypothetical protein VaNZ11_001797 [Volvox africanus]|uniref:Uncharacterized protein n=1 Tax=Volvox africanus TaxID=51714 RepID=A0ABQ5RQN0_9CHLO|nr:hypothetical protein VaNZ11_001797 [Volvox africanus]